MVTSNNGIDNRDFKKVSSEKNVKNTKKKNDDAIPEVLATGFHQPIPWLQMPIFYAIVWINQNPN